jgi:hypothetical protein
VQSNQTGEVCGMMARLNCSGFSYGCCDPVCWNTTAEPAWYDRVCPACSGLSYDTLQPRECTPLVQETVRANLGGFVAILFFSIVLTLTGISLAAFVRKMNQ